MASGGLRSLGQAFWSLPEGLRTTLFPGRNGYRAEDVPAPTVAPDAAVRLYIAPKNSAGQGWGWARAAERLEGVRAVQMQVSRPEGFGFPADLTVASAVVAHSPRWARAQSDAVLQGFTHVLAESSQPLFGRRYADVATERAALRAAGIAVAAVSHGSDVRLPSAHRARERWSPFHDLDSALTRDLEVSATRLRAILDEAGDPEFVSTPDLLQDRPGATWLPVVVDAARWVAADAPLEREVPIVLHAPSRAGLKGTALVRETLQRCADAGLIALELPERTAAAGMPDLVREADIVIDQFSLGIYGVAAVEALAAGRLVVSHVSPFVRETVLHETGLDLPIIEATADTLEGVLDDIRARRDHYREIAARGPAFVAAVHDGRRSAGVLAPFLGLRPAGRE